MEPITLLRGTKDVLPDEVGLWQKIERTSAEVFARYRCTELRTPIIEATELYARGIGEATDIVSKEMYTFTDRGDRSITLRPEGTAGVVRSYIQNKLYSLPGPQKLWYKGPMFRYERPQAGRQRQFNQIGVELFGTAAPKADAEAILMALDIFDSLGVEGLEVQLNSLGCAECRGAYRERLVEYLSARKERYCPDCQTRITVNPLRVLDCKVEACREANREAPSIQETLCECCLEHQGKLEELLAASGVTFRRNPRLVRGLDYYTRTVFEVLSGKLGSQNTLCGGGRYDRLVEECGGPATPAVGWSFGVERLVMILGGKGEVPGINLYVATMGVEAETVGFRLAHELREQGLSVEIDFAGGKLDKQIKQATRFQARYLLIVGENEIQSGELVLKNLTERTQQKVLLAGAAGALAKLLAHPVCPAQA